MRRLLIAAAAVVWALAVAAPSLAAFESDPSASRVSLNPADPESGSVLVSFQGLEEQIVWGQPEKVLSLAFEIDNSASEPFLMKIIDLWLVTGTGTVISQPELRQDGLAVTVAEVPPGETAELTVAFYLGPAEPFDSFHLHWGGRLGDSTVTGVVPFTATEGGGFAQISAAWSASESAAGEQAYQELPSGETYTTYNVYGGYAYPYQPYVSFSFGFGYWWGWPNYWYSPWWPCWRPVACHYGGCYYPSHPTATRQVKEDAVLRQAGVTPDPGGSGRSDARLNETARSLRSDSLARGGNLSGGTRSREAYESQRREPGYRSRTGSGAAGRTAYRSNSTTGRARASAVQGRGTTYQGRRSVYESRSRTASGRPSAYQSRSSVYRSRGGTSSVRGSTGRSRGTSYTSRSGATRGRSTVARSSSVARSRGHSSASRVSRSSSSRVGPSSMSRGRSSVSRSSGSMSRGGGSRGGGGARGGGRGGGRR